MRLAAFSDEGGPLFHTETMLLIRDDQSQRSRVFHIITQQCVGTDDTVDLTAEQASFDDALLLRGKRTGEKRQTQPERGKHALQRLKMLLGEDLGRRHEGRHLSGLISLPDQGSGDQCLAASHITLQEPVHALSADEIRGSFSHGALLRSGRREGKRSIKLTEVYVGKWDPVIDDTAASHLAERAGEQKQLFKNEAASGQLERFEIGGGVNVLIGVTRSREIMLQTDVVRQHLRKLIETGVKSLLYALQNIPLPESGCEPVHRNDPPGKQMRGILFFEDGVHHGAAGSLHLDLSEEDIALTAMDRVLDI